MILIDYSSILHRMISVSSKECQIDETGKYITTDFIYFAMHLALQELYSLHQEHGNKFGNLVLCLDKPYKGYWRNDFLKSYKQKRKDGRTESPFHWNEIYDYSNKLLDSIKNHLPWKVVEVQRAEADDLMLALSRHYNSSEFILIHSPDKDMIQAQLGSINVKQYSPLTKKWIVPEHKNDDMQEWLMEHVCLGDDSDEVPRIIDETIFTDVFKEYLTENNIKYLIPYDFNKNVPEEIKEQLFENFNVYKKNKKGEDTVKDIYVKERFGMQGLEKQIKIYGSLENYLESNQHIKQNYERNKILVLEEGIPTDIWNEIILEYKSAQDNYNQKEFHKFLEENNLNSLKMTLQFESKDEISAADFEW